MAGGSAAGGSVSAPRAKKGARRPPPEGIGAPTKCTPEVIDRLCAEMESLGFVGAACARAGVVKSTVQDWVARGERGEEPFATFAARWAQARARAQATLLENIRGAAASGDWRAAAWALERANPEEYPREPAITVTTNIQPGVAVGDLLARLGSTARRPAESTERAGSA